MPEAVPGTNKLGRELKWFFSAALNPLLIVECSGVIRHANPAFGELLGLDETTVPGSYVEEYVFPEDRAIVESWRQKVADGEKVTNGLIRVVTADGSLRWVSWRIPAVQVGIDRIIAIGEDVTDGRIETERLKLYVSRAQQQADAIINITNEKYVAEGDRANGFKRITEIASQVMGAERTSIWLFDNEGADLICHDLFSQSTLAHEICEPLLLTDFPAYFECVRTQRYVDANEALIDPRTSELTKGYLQQHGITSMLDAPIRAGGEVAGIVCFEHVGAPRVWLDDEKAFAGIIADQVSHLLLHAARKEAEAKLVKLNRELEKRISARTVDLELKNQELESFAYSVSHDLRAPLRAISGYNQMIKEDYSDVLDDDAKMYISRIEAAAHSMSKLIHDLLMYSRFERRTIVAVPVKVRELLDKAIEQLNVSEMYPKAQIDIDVPDTEIRTDVEGVTMALRNLIDNALKFTKNMTVPHVKITAELTDHRCEVAIEDNGIGFDIKHSDKIFEVFQRLERSNDFPGTGVGLALVRKAMQRIHGTVTCESEVGKGSIFRLSIPDAPVS